MMCVTDGLWLGAAAGGWDRLLEAIHSEVGARLASTGALRTMDAALRLVAMYGTFEHMVSPLVWCVSCRRSCSCSTAAVYQQ
jgi:hypothetical protein